MKNLKKNGFEEQMFDDPMVDKEIRVRRNILKVFNKQNCDFRKFFMKLKMVLGCTNDCWGHYKGVMHISK